MTSVKHPSFQQKTLADLHFVLHKQLYYFCDILCGKPCKNNARSRIFSITIFSIAPLQYLLLPGLCQKGPIFAVKYLAGARRV